MNQADAGRRFAGKVALITGANHRGIGGAIAERLGREGASLVLASRSEPTRLLKRLDRMQVAAHWQTCDVAMERDVSDVLATGVGKFERLDIVINNAGFELAEKLDAMSAEDVERLLHVNLEGAIRVARLALPRIARPGGVILQVSSALAMGGCPGFSIYSAAKAGLDGFTRALAWEVAGSGLRVVGVAPGLVHTPMIHKHLDRLTSETSARIEACHPLGMGMPHDVASAVAFLVSDEARWITGVTLPLGWAPHYPLPTGV